TIVLITHELDVIKEICDRVVVMDSGRVVEIGDVYDVFTKPESVFTQKLIEKENRFIIPGNVLENAEGKIIRIDYFDDNAERALIADAIETFGVKINILHGRIEFIKKKPVGVLYISVNGETDQTRDAIRFIRENAGRMEVIRDA
ncbi:MAG: methionine ABC transporter ATP-binding protein, partial [Lachnospiraceae bacterium]|nr:methionine ABC transporter ATP-binding protein [Lachnospiraceae bacterium]